MPQTEKRREVTRQDFNQPLALRAVVGDILFRLSRRNANTTGGNDLRVAKGLVGMQMELSRFLKR